MKKRNIVFLSIFLILIFVSQKLFRERIVIETEKKNNLANNIKEDNLSYSSNIINDVKYMSKGVKGNAYTISALKGEIDYQNSNIIFLTDVEAFIKLKDSNEIRIKSKYGKYNIDNFDTIFSENVISNYLDNKITGEYLDFSLKRNSMIVSRNVVYTNLENVLKADVVEMNLKTKDTKIFMYKNNEKVNIKNKY